MLTGAAAAAGPGGPAGPASPFGPCGPAGPASPFMPWGPGAPAGPVAPTGPGWTRFAPWALRAGRSWLSPLALRPREAAAGDDGLALVGARLQRHRAVALGHVGNAEGEPPAAIGPRRDVLVENDHLAPLGHAP